MDRSIDGWIDRYMDRSIDRHPNGKVAISHRRCACLKKNP